MDQIDLSSRIFGRKTLMHCRRSCFKTRYSSAAKGAARIIPVGINPMCNTLLAHILPVTTGGN